MVCTMMNYYTNMMYGGVGFFTMVLFWILLVLGIVALWKYISKK